MQEEVRRERGAHQRAMRIGCSDLRYQLDVMTEKRGRQELCEAKGHEGMVSLRAKKGRVSEAHASKSPRKKRQAMRELKEVESPIPIVKNPQQKTTTGEQGRKRER